jgi:hypothetical protein
MFLDFLKTLYFKNKKFDITSYTVIHGMEVTEEKLKAIPEDPGKGIFLVTVKAPTVFNPQNLVVQKTLELLPLVVRIPSRTPEQVIILKGDSVMTPIVQRWQQNLQRMASVS